MEKKSWRREKEKRDLIEFLCRERPKIGNSSPTIQVSCKPKLGLAQRPYLEDAQLAPSVGISYKTVVQQRLTHRENL